jgi:trans-aconitate methyltransferase
MGHAWNAEHYDEKLGYVAALGQDLVSLLQPKPGEHILDLGCGTGILTQAIDAAGARVIGMDLSEAMIQRARQKYPTLAFRVGNAEAFHLDSPMDAVFSNAALHWMKNPVPVIECVWNALRPGGRFVAEFGGKGNVVTVWDAIERAVKAGGIQAQEKSRGTVRVWAKMPACWNVKALKPLMQCTSRVLLRCRTATRGSSTG